MGDTRNMTRGKPLGLLIVFALPLMFGNIFQQLYTVVDTAIVGRGVGMDALAALAWWLAWWSWCCALPLPCSPPASIGPSACLWPRFPPGGAAV